MSFVPIMNWLRKISKRLRTTIKYSASNPQSFEESWSFQSNSIRLFSLILIVLILVGVLSVYLFSGPLSGLIGDKEIERSQLEDQNILIEELTEKMNSQEKYIENIRLILSGEVPMNIEGDSIIEMHEVDLDGLKTKVTGAESKLSKEVRNDISTPSGKKASGLTYFGSPIIGVVSQEFDAKNHPGIDVVTTKDKTVKACLGGTVLYSGYTRKDGYILIIGHSGNFISVYKHNKTVLKKMGAKVQLGDPIAIVGNTGENTDGPHLHFELWYNQSPVNPSDYIKFTR
ncbi:MAG: murein DD-endopeptidase MepM/ murein hydrolase activator NlpD [Flavobacteriaceae bacterium]